MYTTNYLIMCIHFQDLTQVFMTQLNCMHSVSTGKKMRKQLCSELYA